ncbi:immunity repressor [Gordonia phage TinaLin]|uniref:Immunity repressor n=1 Tax=Gordonia phage TinaLin TaxID=2797324 RepID=A0A7T7GTH8_9CAUD|nr:transcriptional repressor [Gordonia phage TinaLin]QQM15126.1 immunity repressor [Gordonia phage TinaLin]
MEYLHAALRRKVAREELAIAIGVSVSTVDRRRSEGFSLDEALAIVDYFQLSRTDALLAWDVLELADVMDQLDSDGALVETTSTAELAAEVARRLSNEDGPPSDKPDTSSRPRVARRSASQVRRDFLK